MKGIKVEIDANRPVCAGIRWTLTSGHATVIYGYDEAKSSVWVADPAYGESFITLDTLLKAYQGTGTWSGTYYTKKGA
jgi:hypothetical protein